MMWGLPLLLNMYLYKRCETISSVSGAVPWVQWVVQYLGERVDDTVAEWLPSWALQNHLFSWLHDTITSVRGKLDVKISDTECIPLWVLQNHWYGNFHHFWMFNFVFAAGHSLQSTVQYYWLSGQHGSYGDCHFCVMYTFTSAVEPLHQCAARKLWGMTPLLAVYLCEPWRWFFRSKRW